MTPLRFVINKKWMSYRWLLCLWGVLHLLYVIGLTVYVIQRSELHTTSQSAPQRYSKKSKIGKSSFVTLYLCLNICVACIISVQEIVRILRGHMPWSRNHLMNCYHNGPFRLALVTFSLTLLADSVWAIVDADNVKDYLSVSSMLMGWWLLVFFLRGIRQFSFFTVMIQKIIVGDLFRFSVIIFIELIAFTTGLYIAFRGSTTAEESVHKYGELIVFMFKMMLGLTSLDVLSEAREPWFAVCLYIAFVILTYVLMVNSLIAMMSNTCSVVSENRELQYRVQQLSIILFFESIIPESRKKQAGSPKVCKWYDPKLCRFAKRKRYFMEVKSLHEIAHSESRIHLNPETMLETIFHTVTKIRLPGFIHDSSDDAPVENVRDDLASGALENNYKTITDPNTNIDSQFNETVEKPETHDLTNDVPKHRVHWKKDRRVYPEEENLQNSPVLDISGEACAAQDEKAHKKKKKKKKSKKHNDNVDDDGSCA